MEGFIFTVRQVSELVKRRENACSIVSGGSTYSKWRYGQNGPKSAAWVKTDPAVPPKELPRGGTSLSLRRAWFRGHPRPSQAQGRATWKFHSINRRPDRCPAPKTCFPESASAPAYSVIIHTYAAAVKGVAAIVRQRAGISSRSFLPEGTNRSVIRPRARSCRRRGTWSFPAGRTYWPKQTACQSRHIFHNIPYLYI